MDQASEALIKLEGVSKVFFTDEVETHALATVHLEIGRGDCDVGQLLELHVARTVIEVAVGVHHRQRQLGAANVGRTPITVFARGIVQASAAAPLSISKA